VKNPSGSARSPLALALAAIVAAPASAQTEPSPHANRDSGRLVVALVSLKSLYTNGPDAAANRAALEVNLKRHLDFVDRAAAKGAAFVGFPEMSLSGYRFGPGVTWLSLEGPEVKALAAKASEKKVWIGAGIAEQDAAGKRWNSQVVVGPDGTVAGWHHKTWLTKEKGVVEPGSDRFRAKWSGPWDGGMAPAKTNNDGPEAPMPSGGWIARLKVHAALVNQAGLYGAELDAPAADANTGWAGGAWLIGPDGRTIAQAPASTQKSDSRECLLVGEIPLGPQ
jgi:predicted amidohydrolase